MGSVLTDLASAEVKRNVTTLYGTIVSPPTLLISDGTTSGYACDVNVSAVDSTGQISQYFADKKKKGAVNKDGTTDSGALVGLPGQPPEDWQLDDSLPGHVDTVLHNVPIAKNNAQLRYADANAPVILTRNDLGQWEITGFSIQQPGTHILYPVNVPRMLLGSLGTVRSANSGGIVGDSIEGILNTTDDSGPVGPPINITITVRLLTLAELGELKPFGALPFGASAMYKGGVIIKLV